MNEKELYIKLARLLVAFSQDSRVFLMNTRELLLGLALALEKMAKGELNVWVKV